MGRYFPAVLATLAVLLICSGGTALADYVYPAVTLDYNSGTSTYTYHVLVPSISSFPFGQLIIETKADAYDEYDNLLWTVSGPWVGGTDQGWSCDVIYNWGAGDTVEWRAYGEEEVTIYPWEGDFIVVAPGTSPTPGQGMTKDGVGSDNVFAIDVPGNIVGPEPSSLAALGSLVALAGSLIRRRR